ncbi:uncharacterized protein LACBIDRAFT_316367 [Laccaria bicolor S238N-H82]|uniref:Predicted protein n=1 Tax=Laccaria bicolor (strain S238N-H82 / ATCC MYA-4686) TaxID=486041 RepID=B0E0T7_LACBS|nr:uncharacterized protein LACBIDRAFT_316367 [Laccaria bicolor S238N-H82]EDQ99585.1 predicted protein [Laccaria bicolor S238N-H82]|eukprot:XP_001889809.1 predicted protein [Laccaria bicolor S238N-H82]
MGELEHRRVKCFYARTNKTFGFKRQITKQERRQRFLRNASLKEKRQREASEHSADGAPDPKCYRQSSAHSIPNIVDDPLPNITPKDHYQISDSAKSFERIPKFLSENAGDPALRNFMPLLKEHLLARILGTKNNDNTFTDQDLSTIRFEHDRLYKHRTLRINYTSYDMR